MQPLTLILWTLIFCSLPFSFPSLFLFFFLSLSPRQSPFHDLIWSNLFLLFAYIYQVLYPNVHICSYITILKAKPFPIEWEPFYWLNGSRRLYIVSTFLKYKSEYLYWCKYLFRGMNTWCRVTVSNSS